MQAVKSAAVAAAGRPAAARHFQPSGQAPSPAASQRSRFVAAHRHRRALRCSAGPAGGPPPGVGGGPRDYQVALITGGNTGIGFETAKALLQRGYYVVLGCRNKDKAEAARARLKELVPTSRGIEVAIFDLADLATVRAWAQRAQDFGLPLDVLVNNAGVMACPQMETQDGFEYQLGVNHLGHFLLTNMLLPLLSTADRPSRIVNVSSAAHYFGHIDFDDLQSRRQYNPWKAYGQSKLANVLFTYELERRLPLAANCTANTLHPGVVNTELARYLLPEQTAWWQAPLLEVSKAFALTPEQGAQTSIYLASSPEIAAVSGKYFDKCKPVSSSGQSYNADVARRFWDVSAELVGL
ncbi:retinol dehydrogenase 13 [Chlorella sorokiniana]|uniref:Retinol dehydrogenase 13 n=1 Tax=Chlorella sorokiniana TaxID=3076 RepID=A0A2P6U1J7_CHLSO|nr:retinol dehydrogenase 13 [Chlorella sorokiniana]|eukprot:PRW60169.1 retinol dehydrogenase 13 [Chlorella sorokiniana]